MWEYRHTDELYHYGVPGMKWGHRKSQSVMTARSAYKSASKDLRKAKVKNFFSKSNWIGGYENQQKDKQNQAKIKKLEATKEKAAFNYIDKQAKYAYDKKMSKTGNKYQAEKASMKVHTKAYGKGKGGLVGSVSDEESGGQNTRYHKHLMATKGKQYAQEVERKYSKKLTRDIVGSLALATGLYATAFYLENKD